MSVFECIKVMVATAQAKMDKFDFTLWVLSALFLTACSTFFVILGVHTFFLTAAGAVQFISLLFIATGWLINPIGIFLRGDFYVR